MADTDPVDESLRDAADRFVGDLLDAPESEHAERLAALREQDPALFALVESLTAHLGALDAFLVEPVSARQPDDVPESFDGTRFGRWNVVRSIGRGGMGLVFEVERDDGVVRQRAALKLIQRGVDDESIAERFRTERQILAGLEHPNIGRLIDAGASAEGRPYLVMEFIDGVPLDTWCESKALSIEQRIALFGEVCSAVQYAHQRLVVHRDLKPNNILVTADGTPKLLDFGISKLLDADPARSETIDASTLLTPRYASPEQLTGAPISTASDVYSLGVLLFELLTGDMPYRTRNDSLMDMMRAVMTEEPSRASVAVGRPAREPVEAGDATTSDRDPSKKLARRLRGDLDHILMKALAKEPAERYESASALRDDLARHLAGDPIAAVPPTWRYRANKFVRKHRAAVSFAAVITIAIIALGGLAAREAVRADRARAVAESERAIAERRFEDTRSLAKAMLFELDDAIATGPTKAREQLVRTAIDYLDRLSHDKLSNDLQREVAAGYERIAEILGSNVGSNLGRSKEAKDYLLKALSLRQRLSDAEPANTADLTGLAMVNKNLGLLTQREGAPEEAARYFTAGMVIAKRRAALRPADVAASLGVFAARRNVAVIEYYPDLPNLNRYDDALAGFHALIVDVDAYAAAHPEVPKERIALYLNPFLHDYTQLAHRGGKAREALVTARRSLALSEDGARAQVDDPVAARKVLLSLRTTGELLIELGQDAEGMAMLRRSHALRKQLLAKDRANAIAAREVTEGFAMMGAAYEATGRPREALAEYEEWSRRAEEQMKNPIDPLQDRLDLEAARSCVARMHLALGEYVVALREARQVEREVVALDEKVRADPMAREALGKARVIAARAMTSPRDRDAAFNLAKEGLASFDANAVATPSDAFAERERQRARIETGLLGIASGGTRTEACALIATGRAGLQRLDDAGRLGVPYQPFLKQGSAAAARCGRAG